MDNAPAPTAPPSHRTAPFWYRPLFYVVLLLCLIVLQGILFRQITWSRHHRASALVRTDAETRLAALDQRLSRDQIVRLATEHASVRLLLSTSLLVGLVLLVGGIILDVRWLWRWPRFRALLHALPPRGMSTWSLGDVGRLVILTLVWITVFPFVELGYQSLLRLRVEAHPTSGLLISSTYLSALIVSMAWFLTRAKNTPAFSALGLRPLPSLRTVGRAVASYVTVIPCLAGLLIMSSWAAERLGYQPPPHPLSLFFLDEHRWPWLAYGVVFTCLVAPTVEEMLFRGVLYPALRTRTPFWVAASVSGALFGALHANGVSMLPITGLGLLLAYLYETTGSLYASIAVHAMHNSVMVLLMALYRELSRALGS